MDRYQRVDKPRPEASSIKENEVRITTQGKMRNYITYATSLLQDRRISEIVLKAMGRAINKTVMITEIIKRRIGGLHQNTVLSSTDITDLWEPLEEGLLPLETTRHVSMISITLSKKQLDVSSSGYQPPLPVEQVQPQGDFDYEGASSPHWARGRGRDSGRGGRGRGRGGGYYNFVDENWNRGRGRVGARGRGYRGRGRGYNADFSQADMGRYDDGGYGDRDMAPRGRGRGWGRGRGRGRGR